MIDWLKRHRQTPGAIENFWRVILTSALNEELERLSSLHAFKVFRDGFLRNRRGYRMGVPVVPLADCHAVSVGITTVHGRACFGVYADREALPDADALAHDIDDAIGELLGRTQRP